MYLDLSLLYLSLSLSLPPPLSLSAVLSQKGHRNSPGSTHACSGSVLGTDSYHDVFRVHMLFEPDLTA